MPLGILAILMLLLGTASLVSLGLSRSRGSAQLTASRDARSVAEAGINRIIASFNQPENRRLLVSGMAMGSWSSDTSNSLQSPCIKTDGTRPGPNGDGLPSATARNYGDGQFRDLETGAVDSGERRFSLRTITYAAGTNGASDRRSIRVSSTAGSSDLTLTGSGYSGALINLDDPDGIGTRKPGFNQGYVTLTVEGRVVRSDGSVATALVTREFLVVPKCCGASFGSNGSGGSTLGNDSSSLGADSRYCGVDFGVITGINGGAHWSLYANDSYTTRNTAGQIVPLNNIIGDITGMA
jgi:hypothetical protein